MRAQFDLSLRDEHTLSPKSQKVFPYFAIAANTSTSEQNIVLVNPFGVIFIDSGGRCTYSETEWFNENYRLVEKPKEASITFRNDK